MAGLMLAFSGFMWSQAVIVEVYTLSVLSLMGVLCCLYRWTQDTSRMRYLYWSFFWFGICLCNHQTLIVAAMGIETAILFAHPRLGRNFFTVNSIVYLVILVLMITDSISLFAENIPMQIMFHLLGLSFLLVSGFLWMATVVKAGEGATLDWRDELRDGVKVLWSGLAYAGGAAFYLYMPLASMTNPPLNWGYPRTWEGFTHAFSRGQYAQTNPTTSIEKFIDQIIMYWNGAFDEFNASFLLLFALLPICFIYLMRNRERGWMIGTFSIYLCLAVLLMILLNPNNDKHGQDMTRVFFAASHVMLAMWIGFGVSLFVALVAKCFEKFCVRLLLLTVVASGVALADWANKLAETQFFLDHWTRGFAFCLLVFLGAMMLVHRPRRGSEKTEGPPIRIVLIVLALMPIWSGLAHWQKSEQRGHLFGYWYGHDMFTPPFPEADGSPIYPEMSENAILFGGTDPGRFNPTYMIFAESFTPPGKKPRDPKFDRRDVALITQNALADRTYLDTVRAHYQRSAQDDWQQDDESRLPFASGARSKLIGPKTSTGISGAIDRWMVGMGSDWEVDRRTWESYFEEEHILNPSDLAKRLTGQADAAAGFIASKLPAETLAALKGGSEDTIRELLANGFDVLLDGGPLWDDAAFKAVEFSPTTVALQKQVDALKEKIGALGQAEPDRVEDNGLYVRWKHARVRLNRRVLDEVFAGLIKPGKAGLYPDLELNSPTELDLERSFAEYTMEAAARDKAGQPIPGEQVIRDPNDGRVISVAGQVSVMGINAKLAKVLFDKNPDRDFFVEVSFPLEWMYPHLTPYGIILKLNREEVPEITDEMMRKDRRFWAEYQSRLTGNWITDETSIRDIGLWTVKTYKRWELDGYTGARAFVRDQAAQKAFSKLRGSIADMYRWRIDNYRLAITKEQDSAKRAELMLKKKRMTREYLFALKQAWAFNPFNPEVVMHLAQLMLQMGEEQFHQGDKKGAAARRDDLFYLTHTFQQFDPESVLNNGLIQGLMQFITTTKLFDIKDPLFRQFVLELLEESITSGSDVNPVFLEWYDALKNGETASFTPTATPKQSGGLGLSSQEIQQIQQQLIALQQRHTANPSDPQVTLELATIYLRLKQDDAALKLIDALVKQPNLEISTRFTVASLYRSLGQVAKADEQNRMAGDALQKLEANVAAKPGDFDQSLRLASAHVLMGQNQKGVDVLIKSIDQPNINTTNLLLAAEFFNRIGDSKNLEAALVKLTGKMPDNPEGWYDLAGVQASNGSRTKEAWATLAKALKLDKQRRATNSTADNLYERVEGDPRFTDVRRLPEFKAWIP
ncbi:MAG: hypothetical protein CMO63_07310 [Verrucomicrobiales bacterium]|nr:hypothetical protein [Verrucomicrobiales bacterium]